MPSVNRFSGESERTELLIAVLKDQRLLAHRAIKTLFEDDSIRGITVRYVPHDHELLSRRVLGTQA